MVELKEPNLGGTATLPHKFRLSFPASRFLDLTGGNVERQILARHSWLIHGKDAAVCSLTLRGTFFLSRVERYQSQWMLTTEFIWGWPTLLSPRRIYTMGSGWLILAYMLPFFDIPCSSHTPKFWVHILFIWYLSTEHLLCSKHCSKQCGTPVINNTKILPKKIG